MGKNGSKNFVNQFKNTRRQAGQAGRPLAGLAYKEPRKLVKVTARHTKKILTGERKNEKNPDRADK
ncbi:MAG: hypothetical protein WCL37_08285 [Chrysiogenales bacterium]